MTPEERFTKIENLLQAITEQQAEQQARNAEQQARTDARLDRIAAQSAEYEIRFRETGERIDLLAAASHDLVRVSRHLVRSHRTMEQLLEHQSRRLDHLEGNSQN